jgi:hypothetical protein
MPSDIGINQSRLLRRIVPITRSQIALALAARRAFRDNGPMSLPSYSTNSRPGEDDE